MINNTNAYNICLNTIAESIISAGKTHNSLLMKTKYKTVLGTILNNVKTASKKHKVKS